MLVYVVSAIIFILVALNFFLGERLYKIPKDTNYFNNVEEYNISSNKEIIADPKYVLTISILTGILLGSYLGLATVCNVHNIIVTLGTVTICCCYLAEITRRVAIRDGVLVLSRFLMPKKEIDANRITGIYLYSYNRKFMDNHAYTVKLVVAQTSKKLTKFALSSIDNRAIMNMIKDNFGVKKNKMYIANQKELITKD